MKPRLILLFLGLVLFNASRSMAQNQTVIIRGTVIDSASGTPLQQVSVFQNSSGRGTLTDLDGRYALALSRDGLLRFAYLGYRDVTIQIKILAGDQNLNVRMGILPFFTPELHVTARKLYKLDSLNYRKENAALFASHRKVSMGFSGPSEQAYTTGFILSPSVFYANFISAKAKRMRAFRKTLEQGEKATYIESRFNRQIVNRITGLGEADLDNFIVQNRPSYAWLVSSCAPGTGANSRVKVPNAP